MAAWDREINKRAEELTKEGLLDRGLQDKLYEVWLAGHSRIERERDAEHAAEITKLDTHLESILAKNATHTQQLKAQYDKDVAQFGQAELAKALLASRGEFDRVETEQRFAKIQAALLGKYSRICRRCAIRRAGAGCSARSSRR